MTVAALATVCGCTVSPAPGAGVGARFYRAVAVKDWVAACRLLAPETRAELEKAAGTGCRAVLASEELPDPGPVRTSVSYGTMTQVRFERDTVFLARFQSGWRVMAAGCSPKAGRPYDCRLQGG